MAGSKGTAEIATRYPVEEGLTARTTKQTGDPYLRAEGLNGVKNTIRARDKVGID